MSHDPGHDPGQSPGQSVVDGFRYVRDVYRTVARLFAAADPLLYEHGYLPYDASWRPMSVYANHGQPDGWLTDHAVRQYHRREREGQEVLTVGAVFWNPWDEGFAAPLLVGSSVRLQRTPESVYWIGVIQPWAASAPADGQVYLVRADDCDLERHERAELESVVAGPIASLAVPLVEIADASALHARIIRPLVEHIRAAEAAAGRNA